ncbi:RES domain-containing protein [Bradyrhizobium sp. 193]|uniref:RES domain-containing protein n=1 Tax=Bradyrhizobium sp. 193 TaxID=2782661 RepID=UPI001FFBD8CA|nr:RES domain-containing protein [Bradyrhizobium sp. 193]
MGAPQRRLAADGRANPPGIPYLYLGSLPETAVAEGAPSYRRGRMRCRFCPSQNEGDRIEKPAQAGLAILASTHFSWLVSRDSRYG